jgi:hypothetical protein
MDALIFVTNEPVECEKLLVEVQDFRKITCRFRDIYKIICQSSKENPEDHNM